MVKQLEVYIQKGSGSYVYPKRLSESEVGIDFKDSAYPIFDGKSLKFDLGGNKFEIPVHSVEGELGGGLDWDTVGQVFIAKVSKFEPRIPSPFLITVA